MSERARGIAGPVLAVLAALLLLLALVTGYASGALFDSDEFADRATAALEDEAVQSEIARRVTDDLVLNADADLVAVRPVIESVVSGVVGGGVFQSLFRSGVADVHRAAFRQDENTVTLTVADIGTVVRGALQALRPQLAEKIEGGADAEVTEIEPPALVADLAQLAEDVAILALVLLVLGVGFAVAAVWLSPDRRRTVLVLGVAVVIAGVLSAVGLGIARTLVLAGIDETGVRDAVDAIWRAFMDDLRNSLYLFAACGAVIAAAASSLLRPVDIAAPLRGAWALIATVPERPRLRALRAVALIVAGIAIVVLRDQVVDLVVILAGLYVAYAGVSELMRMTIAAGEAEREAQRRSGRRTLIATAIATAVIVIAGTAFVGLGGTTEESQAIETVGCNASEALCDRPLDQVAFPTTHNAMSAVTNEDWLFGQQDAGFPDQLADGIRGLAIDAHYGQPTVSGTVKTDLSDLSGSERATYEDELGTQALDAALRIRDRVVNSPPTGDRQVYLCHRFCELGAVPILDAFRQYRDFLAANPDEVLVIVIEDYVRPADIADAVEQSGLIDYVYTGSLGPPLPTLGEMIDSGGRVLMLAENEPGGEQFPWYHAAYDELVQETPYTFKTPEELTDPGKLDETCEPNRGPDDAPLFLINHWVDTSPAPKPSNAKKVNAYDALLERVGRCEQIRGLPASLISVDFYRQGDLFDVVAELNATSP